mgnify:CR=1 FL=1
MSVPERLLGVRSSIEPRRKPPPRRMPDIDAMESGGVQRLRNLKSPIVHWLSYGTSMVRRPTTFQTSAKKNHVVHLSAHIGPFDADNSDDVSRTHSSHEDIEPPRPSITAPLHFLSILSPIDLRLKTLQSLQNGSLQVVDGAGTRPSPGIRCPLPQEFKGPGGGCAGVQEGDAGQCTCL